MAKLFPLACVLILAGCASTADKQASIEREQAMTTKFDRYQAQLADPALDAIRDKVTLTETRHNRVNVCATPAAAKFPTPAERAAIQSWSASRASYVSYLKDMEPVSITTQSNKLADIQRHYFDTLLTAADQVSASIDDLAKGRINYCQFSEQENAINGEAIRIASRDQSEIAELVLAIQRSHIGASNDLRSIPVSLCYGECPRPR
jgi:hypothetical protein